MSAERMKLKLRLCAIGKTQCELIPHLTAALPQYKISPADICRAYSEAGTEKKHEAIREQTEKIIMKWEAEKNVQREALHA